MTMQLNCVVPEVETIWVKQDFYKRAQFGCRSVSSNKNSWTPWNQMRSYSYLVGDRDSCFSDCSNSNVSNIKFTYIKAEPPTTRPRHNTNNYWKWCTYRYLKLVRTNLNYRVLGTSTAAIFFQMIIFYMHLLHRMHVMLDFICMGPVELSGACRKRQNIKFKILGTRTHNLYQIM